MVVSVLGLIGAVRHGRAARRTSRTWRPGPAQEILTQRDHGTSQGAGSASGIAFVIGLAAAIWASSGYVNGFMSASNAIYDVEEGRPDDEDAAACASASRSC